MERRYGSVLRTNAMMGIIAGIAMMSCVSVGHHDARIDSVEVRSLGWNDHYSLSMSAQRIVRTRDASITVVSDRAFLQKIEVLIDRVDVETGRDESPIDGRLLCLIHRASARTDTLMFGRFDMEYDGKVYDLDTNLLRLVGTTQSAPYQRLIERWIAILKEKEAK